MDPFSIAMIVIGAVSALGSIGSVISQAKTNNKSLELDQRNYDYTVAQNELTRQREDTAHQREVSDLKAAGLSPLASLGGASSSVVPGFSSMPNLVSPFSGASQQLANMAEGLRDIWKVKTGEKRADVQNAFDERMETLRHINRMEELASEIESREKISSEQISSSEKIAEGQQSTQKEVATMNNAQSQANSIREQATAYRQISTNVSLSTKRLNQEQSKALMENFRDFGVVHFKFNDDSTAVKFHNDAVMSRYRQFQEKNLKYLGKSSTSSSDGVNVFGLGGINNSRSGSSDYKDRYDALNKSFWSDPNNDIWICNNNKPASRVSFKTTAPRGSLFRR